MSFVELNLTSFEVTKKNELLKDIQNPYSLAVDPDSGEMDLSFQILLLHINHASNRSLGSSAIRKIDTTIVSLILYKHR